MKFIVIDDRKANLYRIKECLKELNIVFRCVNGNGELSNSWDCSDGKDFISFNFTNINEFVNSFINEIDDDDIILIDLALTADERDTFDHKKIVVPSNEIKHTPKIIKAIIEIKENANIKVMSKYEGLTSDKYADFLTEIKNETWFENIKYIETAIVIDAYLADGCKEMLLSK